MEQIELDIQEKINDMLSPESMKTLTVNKIATTISQQYTDKYDEQEIRALAKKIVYQIIDDHVANSISYEDIRNFVFESIASSSDLSKLSVRSLSQELADHYEVDRLQLRSLVMAAVNEHINAIRVELNLPVDNFV